MNRLHKVILFFLLLFALLGMADSGYLLYEHLGGDSPVCIVGEGCGIVTQSVYSEIAGVPIALVGFLYYIIFFSLSVWFIIKESARPINILRVLLTLGLIFSTWLVYLQVFVIESICFYCIVSATLTLLSFALIWFLKPVELK